MRKLDIESNALQEALKEKNCRLVLAESCTGGMAAAALAGNPGISEFLCGSLVTYRVSAKQSWLGISARSIENWNAVSARTSMAMARAALKKTPEADLAVGVTGHLGPLAKRERHREGQVFIAVAFRARTFTIVHEFYILTQRKTDPHPRARPTKMRRVIDKKQLAQVLRKKRQILASHAVLFMVRSMLNDAL